VDRAVTDAGAAVVVVALGPSMLRQDDGGILRALQGPPFLSLISFHALGRLPVAPLSSPRNACRPCSSFQNESPFDRLFAGKYCENELEAKRRSQSWRLQAFFFQPLSMFKSND